MKQSKLDILANKLKGKRAEKGLIQEDVSALLNISFPQIGKMENSKTIGKVKLETVIAYMDLVDLNFIDFE